ncbi:hypothetical protein KTT_53010 [Tengunoibacter tsumagoiensis]|uniref:Uncharacterized protein n=1 Tax=Tengunoibacter tsumagoiensis TaxID=2014871 RepID=A0A402A8F7_9CHLR|nr:hypothetical protein KTT_53010 [Tengunoibacter tsumagoiensis]
MDADQERIEELLKVGLSVRKVARVLKYSNHHSLNTYPTSTNESSVSTIKIIFSCLSTDECVWRGDVGAVSRLDFLFGLMYSRKEVKNSEELSYA